MTLDSWRSQKHVHRCLPPNPPSDPRYRSKPGTNTWSMMPPELHRRQHDQLRVAKFRALNSCNYHAGRAAAFLLHMCTSGMQHMLACSPAVVRSSEGAQTTTTAASTRSLVSATVGLLVTTVAAGACAQ